MNMLTRSSQSIFNALSYTGQRPPPPCPWRVEYAHRFPACCMRRPKGCSAARQTLLKPLVPNPYSTPFYRWYILLTGFFHIPPQSEILSSYPQIPPYSPFTSPLSFPSLHALELGQSSSPQSKLGPIQQDSELTSPCDHRKLQEFHVVINRKFILN